MQGPDLLVDHAPGHRIEQGAGWGITSLHEPNGENRPNNRQNLCITSHTSINHEGEKKNDWVSLIRNAYSKSEMVLILIVLLNISIYLYIYISMTLLGRNESKLHITIALKMKKIEALQKVAL